MSLSTTCRANAAHQQVPVHVAQYHLQNKRSTSAGARTCRSVPPTEQTQHISRCPYMLLSTTGKTGARACHSKTCRTGAAHVHVPVHVAQQNLQNMAKYDCCTGARTFHSAKPGEKYKQQAGACTYIISTNLGQVYSQNRNKLDDLCRIHGITTLNSRHKY